jgi:dTDP-4-amino-4,6-dideoxygalactose transaminase
VGIVQLKKLDFFIDEREKWAKFYNEALKDIAWLRTPVVGSDYKHGWQSYVIYIDESKAPISRNDMMEKLQQMGVSTRPGTHAPHMLKYYADKYSIDPNDFPGARDCNNYSMSIPLFNKMTKEDYEYVVYCLKSI